MVKDLKRRLFNIALAVDQALFTLATLGYAYPDEAPSAAAWRLEQEGRWQGRLFRPLIDWVFSRLLKDNNHCRNAFMSEVLHRRMPPVYATRAREHYLGIDPQDTSS